MPQTVHITISLTPEASVASVNQIEDKIRSEASIPFCKQIETVTIDDTDDSYTNLKKHGISNNVAKNILDLYNQE